MEQIRSSCLNIQVCLGDNLSTREYIGFAAIPLDTLTEDKMLDNEVSPIIDLRADIFYYTVLTGKMEIGVKLMSRSRKLKV